MLNEIISLIYRSIETGYNWLLTIGFSFRINLLVIFVSIVTISAVLKYVLSPYFTGSSDSAKISKGKGKKG